MATRGEGYSYLKPRFWHHRRWIAGRLGSLARRLDRTILVLETTEAAFGCPTCQRGMKVRYGGGASCPTCGAQNNTGRPLRGN